MNRFDWVGQWAAYHGPKEAISEEESGRRFTYGELNNAANALWEHLETRHNLRRGDRVAILAENHPDHFILFALAQKSGIILVPFNFRLAPPEIAFLIHDSKPALLLVEEKFRPLLAAVPDGELPPLMDFEALIALNEGHREQAPAKEALLLDEDDPLFILYTSGTTGFPKGAIYTHKMAFWNSVNTGLRLDLTSSDRTICCLPLFHTGGWNVLSVPFLHRGAYFHMTRKFEAENILTLLEKTRSTIFMGVPTILKMMAQSPQFEAVDLSSLRYFIVGGEAMPVPLILTWHEKGVPIRQGYGLTEVGPNITSLHQDDATRKIGSIGVPNFYVQTRIVGDDGRDVAPGENGELWLSGPMTTPGYWNNPQESAKALKSGWFCTGDVVRADEEGFIYVVDRKKNLFISGGENVYPAEIERVLQGHPDILEAAVIGIPDPKWGESGKAFVALKPGKQLSETEVINFCRENLAKFKVPKEVAFLDALPKGDTGKIDRRGLGN